MAITITVGNQKGGIGKTTTAVNLALELNKLGKKTLLIDCDPQCNASDTLNAHIEGHATLYDLLLEKTPIYETIQKTKQGDIIPCDPLLSSVEQKLTDVGREQRLKECIEPILNDYDYIIFDTPPTLGILLINTLAASNFVIIPVTTDRYTINGLQEFFDNAIKIKNYINPDLKIMGILLVKFDNRTTIAKQIADILPQKVKEWAIPADVFDTKIRNSIAVVYSQAERLGLKEYDSSTGVAEDYEKLAHEVMTRSI